MNATIDRKAELANFKLWIDRLDTAALQKLVDAYSHAELDLTHPEFRVLIHAYTQRPDRPSAES